MGAGSISFAIEVSSMAQSIVTCVRPFAAFGFTRNARVLSAVGSSEMKVGLLNVTTPPRTCVGAEVGDGVGDADGDDVGDVLGELEGDADGDADGDDIGELEGDAEGDADGNDVEELEGVNVVIERHRVPSHILRWPPVHSVSMTGHA